MSEKCDDVMPEQDETILCDRPPHAFGWHSNVNHGEPWKGEPLPVTRKPKNDPKKDIRERTESEVKTGPPVSGSHVYLPSQPTDTQAAAAASVLPKTGTMRRRVYDEILRSGGATDEEIQVALEMNPSTVRPRRLELVEQGFVVDSGLRRATASGEAAIVWAGTP